MIRTLLVLLLIAMPAAAEDFGREITPFVGWQHGGALWIDNRNAPLDDAPAFGVMVTFDKGRGRMLDLVFTHEMTNAVRGELMPPGGSVAYRTFIDTAQIGGRYVFSPAQRLAPYIAMTAGGTWIGANGQHAIGFSFAYGAGADVRLSARTAIRFDGRFTSLLASQGGSVRCDSSGSCGGLVSGSLLTQFTASTGLAVRF